MLEIGLQVGTTPEKKKICMVLHGIKKLILQSAVQTREIDM